MIFDNSMKQRSNISFGMHTSSINIEEDCEI